MAQSAMIVSNSILRRAKKDKIKITSMKLQKLLYFVSVVHAKQKKEILISEPFEVWKTGPVIHSVYEYFKPYGKKPIKNYWYDACGIASCLNEKHYLIFEFELVWELFKNFTAQELAEMQTWPNSGWDRAYREHREIITLEDMLQDNTLVIK